MKYIQALKEKGYSFLELPKDIQKAIGLVLKSKDYNSKIEALDLITFNSIRSSQPVDDRIEELYKLSLTDNSVEDNNGFNTPQSIEIAEQEFATGGHIATKTDNNKVRDWKVRFHLGKGENFMKWKIENPDTKEIRFENPDSVQIEMTNCKLANSPKTAMKIFTGEIDKSPIAWVLCEDVKVDKKIDPVDPEERLSYNPRTAPNWFDTDGDNVDNYVFEKLVTFGRGVYYEAPSGKLYKLGGEIFDIPQHNPEAKTFYERTHADGRKEQFSVEDYENNIYPELMAQGKKIAEFPEVELDIYANNQYYTKTKWKENALIDVKNEKIKFTQLDTFGEDYRLKWIKVKENSNGYYIDYDYFGGRIFIENWYWLMQENKPEKMADGKKIDEVKIGDRVVGKFEYDYTYNNYQPIPISDWSGNEYEGIVKAITSNFYEVAFEGIDDIITYPKSTINVLFELDRSSKFAYGGTIWQHKHMDATAKILERTNKGYKVEFTDNSGKKPTTKIQFFNDVDFSKDKGIFYKIGQKETPETIVPEPIIEKEQFMETTKHNGSNVSNWNEVPVRWKNVKAVRPITINLNPYDKGLNTIISHFTSDDSLRPVFSAINFSDSGIVCTDAHKLLHIHYKHSDFKGNYPTPDTYKAYGKFVAKDDVAEKIKEEKFPNWEAVIPKDNPHTYEVDTMMLYQYVKVAVNYANKTTNQVAFKYNKSQSIGFNGKFLIQILETMMKMQSCPKIYLHLSEPSRAMLISFDKHITTNGNTYALLMPVMLLRNSGSETIQQIYGASDIDYDLSLSCYFDFEDSRIHNGNGSIADYKESYGDTEEMPLALITMLDRFIKTSKNRLPVLDCILVDGNGIRVDNFEARIELSNDWNLEAGLYRIENNALIRNTLSGNVDEFPILKDRVPTKEPIFTMDADIFKFYLQKASEHCGNDDLRETLKCILFQQKDNGLEIVSTDAYSVFHANVQKYTESQDKNYSYPIESVKQLMNFAKNIDGKQVSFYADATNSKYRISGGRLHFEARISTNRYPNWEGVVPREFTNQLTFNIKDLYVCMNNEASKLFMKNNDLKPAEVVIYNQNDQIYLSNMPYQGKPEDRVSSEICEMKITKQSFELAQSFFPSRQNFILLMPSTATNGNYFNFTLNKLNDVIASIGKEKVIVDYSELHRAYLFTSDNLNYKTSDNYKPEKAVSPVKKATPSPVKMNKPTKMDKVVPSREAEINKLSSKLRLLDKWIGTSNKTELTDAYHRIVKWMPKDWKGLVGWEAVSNEYFNAKDNKNNPELVKEVEAILENKSGLTKNPVTPKDDTQELKKAIKGLEAFLFSFGATKTKANLEESKAVQGAINGLKALLK